MPDPDPFDPFDEDFDDPAAGDLTDECAGALAGLFEPAGGNARCSRFFDGPQVAMTLSR